MRRFWNNPLLFLSMLFPIGIMAKTNTFNNLNTFFSFKTKPKTGSLLLEKDFKGLSLSLNLSQMFSQTNGPLGDIHFKSKNIEGLFGLGHNSGETSSASNQTGFESGYYTQNDTTQEKQDGYIDKVAFSYKPNLNFKKAGNLEISYAYQNNQEEHIINAKTNYEKISFDTTMQEGITNITTDTIDVNSTTVTQVKNDYFTSIFQIDSKKAFDNSFINLLRYGISANWFYSHIKNKMDNFISVYERGNVRVHINGNDYDYPFESESSSTGHNEDESEQYNVSINPYFNLSGIYNIRDYPFCASLGLEEIVNINDVKKFTTTVTGFVSGKSAIGVNYNIKGKIKTGDNGYQNFKIELLNKSKKSDNQTPISIRKLREYINEINVGKNTILNSNDALKEYEEEKIKRNFEDNFYGIGCGLEFENENGKDITASAFAKKYGKILGLNSVGLGAGASYNKEESTFSPYLNFEIVKGNWRANFSANKGEYGLDISHMPMPKKSK